MKMDDKYHTGNKEKMDHGKANYPSKARELLSKGMHGKVTSITMQ